MVGDYSYVVHIESLLEVLKSGRNVFSIPVDAGLDVSEQIDLGHIGTVVAELERLPERTITYERGCDVRGEDRTGFEAAIAAAAAADIAVMVMGERSGLTQDCTSGESRDVAELRLPGVQGRAGAGGRGDGDAGGPRAGGRAADRLSRRARGGGRADGLAPR